MVSEVAPVEEQWTFVLELKHVITLPASKLWRCWTEPDLARQWFCPRPWVVSDMRIDLRAGGEFYYVMEGPDDLKVVRDGVILEVEHERKLVITDAFRVGWIPNGEPFMTGHMLMEPTADGHTDYRMQAMHWNAEQVHRHVQSGFHEGWATTIAQLEVLAETL